MESAWLWTVALGAGWLDTRTDPSPPSKFPQKASSASLYLEAAFFLLQYPHGVHINPILVYTLHHHTLDVSLYFP